MPLEGCHCTWVVELASSIVYRDRTLPPSLSSSQRYLPARMELPVTRCPLPRAGYLQGRSTNSRQRRARKTLSGRVPLQAGRPAAHVDHELFVNTDNQWAKDCIDHMTRIDMCSTCQLFTTECIKARRFLINPSKPSCYDPLDNTH